MRDAQIESIRTYLYLKIACGNICGDETVYVL